VVIEIKALACELPSLSGLPLSRLSIADIQSEAVDRGLVAAIGETTIWRWLSEDAIRPWRHRSWIFPRDPEFAPKASRVLDLYEGVWEDEPLGDGDFVVCADEKTSIQARQRRHPSKAPGPGTPMRYEHEYHREGALAYLAAWDVHRARLHGRCEPRSGIEPFERLVEQVMVLEPYRSAQRVFWVVDNGSSHRGERAVRRLHERWPTLLLIHTPVHASWLNQCEIYFSVVQRKVLTPNDFPSLAALEDNLLGFQDRYQRAAVPFQWRFTRRDLQELLAKLDRPDSTFRLAA